MQNWNIEKFAFEVRTLSNSTERFENMTTKSMFVLGVKIVFSHPTVYSIEPTGITSNQLLISPHFTFYYFLSFDAQIQIFRYRVCATNMVYK